MKASKGQSQPEIAADLRLLGSLHGSGSTILIPGFDYDSCAFWPELRSEDMEGHLPELSHAAPGFLSAAHLRSEAWGVGCGRGGRGWAGMGGDGWAGGWGGMGGGMGGGLAVAFSTLRGLGSTRR